MPSESSMYSVPLSRDSGNSAPTFESQVRTCAGEKTSAPGVNEDVLQGVREPVPNGTLDDTTLALSEIKFCLSRISSNLSKLVFVERRHVAPPAIIALLHLSFLMLVRQPIENVISALFSTLLLMTFAWPVWTTLKPMRHLLDGIDVKMDALQEPIHRRLDEVNLKMDVLKNSIESIRLAVSHRVDYVPVVQPVLPDSVEAAPPRQEMPIKLREAPVAVSVERCSQLPESSFGHWSSTLSEIKQKIESLASDTLHRLPQLDQREPVDLVTQRRISLRLFMYLASIPTADLASPNGFLGPPASVYYYPTGDLEGDRDIAFTAALDYLDELMVLLTGNAQTEIAVALSELAQALSDLGLNNYASNVSSFALEVLRVLYAADPYHFRSRIASIQSLRANILADLRQNDDAADAAEEAVTILKEKGETQPEFIYAMLNYAVLLGSIGRGEGAAAVAFELKGYIDDSTILQPDIVLVSPLCQLCVSNACIDFDSDLALSEADKAIEASRGSTDGNSKVVLAGALLTKSKILSSNGQNDAACSISAEAVSLFRTASADRRVFSLLLAHALFTNSHHFSEANRKGESHSTIRETVELWQTLQFSIPVASKRPLAWALFELAKYRLKGADKQQLCHELQYAESAVSTFREVSPLDFAGLADALFTYADRMLELDKNREAATYAEESVQYFRVARENSTHQYALDLIFSLSLASSCLACTERAGDALEYAKEAVGMQHGRKDDGDPQFKNHLRLLLIDVIARFTEMGRQPDAKPWVQELQQLGAPGDKAMKIIGQEARRHDEPQPKNDTELRKETNDRMEEVNPAPSPGAAAAIQLQRDGLAAMDFARGGSFGSGNNSDPFSGLLDMGSGMGGRTLGKPGSTILTDRPLGIGSLTQRAAQALPPPSGRVGRSRLSRSEMSGLAGLESLLGGLGGLGPDRELGGLGGGGSD